MTFIIFIILFSFIILIFLLLMSSITIKLLKTSLDKYHKTPIILVTAASDNHFKSLLQFLSSVKKYSNGAICYVWDIGLNSENISKLHSSYHKIIRYQKFEYSKYPSFFNVHIEKGQYAWKPAIIKKTMEKVLINWNVKKKMILFWCDAGNMLTPNSFPMVRNIVNKNRLYSPLSSDNIQKWTHPGTLNYFNISINDPILQYECRNAAVLGFMITDKEIQKLIKQWELCGMDKKCIAPIGSNRENHRQDQSALTILYYRFFDNHPQYESINEMVCHIHCDVD